MIERYLTQELQTYFPAQVEYVLRDPLLFGDCRNAINANNQKRIYEDLIDYDSVFYLFQEVSIRIVVQKGLMTKMDTFVRRYYWNIKNIMACWTWYSSTTHWTI